MDRADGLVLHVGTDVCGIIDSLPSRRGEDGRFLRRSRQTLGDGFQLDQPFEFVQVDPIVPHDVDRAIVSVANDTEYKHILRHGYDAETGCFLIAVLQAVAECLCKVVCHL